MRDFLLLFLLVVVVLVGGVISKRYRPFFSDDSVPPPPSFCEGKPYKWRSKCNRTVTKKENLGCWKLKILACFCEIQLITPFSNAIIHLSKIA